MPDWSRAFRNGGRASYKGAGFWVEIDELQGGRRVAVHPIAGGAWLAEDMGRRVGVYRPTAYVASDGVIGEGKALEAACNSEGPGFLSLPMDALVAHCDGFRRNRDKDRNGLIAYDLIFIAEGASASAGLSAGAAIRAGFSANFGSVSVAVGASARFSAALGF
ncbi:DNA circularization N-terminal domain-containing protein [Jiella marina]|uniref:DNA circularization N-terminal domain-containing protein n=1 Tax=Jiella sp. LLJ827 TaxID=2917712 RepID=UPI0021017C14|nr:DNA circularization N-terminal domain-containing protein [Jiella sp. LLJ827]MCQ0986398.1 DNA circularization N-terminal domain-containing protein [Jiella sp. LLJ827]